MRFVKAVTLNLSLPRGHLRAAIAAALLTAGALAASAAAAGLSVPNGSKHYSFQTFDNKHDLTFNQLLGINERGTIAGYFGSGLKGHPNKGYLLTHFGRGKYINENFPGSTQTQVTGLNDHGVTVGFWANRKGANFGFYALHGSHFTVADYPTKSHSKPPTDQLLGVNDHKVAVGFYNDSKGNSHGYTYNIKDRRFHQVAVAGATSVTAAAINNEGDIAGFEKTSKGATVGFLRLSSGHVIKLSVPGASMTLASGVNDGDVVVGVYQVGTGSGAKMYGFTWAPGFGFQTVSDPSGVGATTVNGLNDRGWLVGFYTDSKGNTDGFLAKPRG